jgi:ribose transport system permease protein
MEDALKDSASLVTDTPPSESRTMASQAALLPRWFPRIALVGVWVILFTVFAAAEPSSFLQTGTFQTIFGSQESLAFISLGLLSTLMVGEFDLSPASMFGLAGSVVAVLMVNHGMSAISASLIAVALTTVAGLINAIIIVVFGVDSIVTTLGMSTILLGVSLGVTGLQSVSGMSPGFANIANHDFLGLPAVFFCGIILFGLYFYISKFTPLGQHAAFTAANKDVALLAGVRVNALRMGAYTLSGLVCGIGGVLSAASLQGFDPATSSSFLLPSLAAVFLGTAAIEPGRFNPLGTLVGIYFLETGVVGLTLVGLSGWTEQVFYGGMLILAVAATTFLRKRTDH